MYAVVERNKEPGDDVFKNRPLRSREPEMLIWGALKVVQYLHAPSQINNASDGKALMDGSADGSKTKNRDTTGAPRSKTKQKKTLKKNLSEDVASRDGRNDDIGDEAGEEEHFDFSQPEPTPHDIELAEEIYNLLDKTLQVCAQNISPCLSLHSN
jgi:hypothetical protein